MEEQELNLGANFLYCKNGGTPFKFLGVPVGANPRVSSTWKLVVEKMKDRLSLWRSRQLSIGGRLALNNSVLASLPLYYISFFKAPKKVIKEMVNDNLWSTMMEFFYGKEGILNRTSHSVWWKDLNSIEDCLTFGRNWFSNSIRLKLGDGKIASFWEDRWCSPWKLVKKFPQLFAASAFPTGIVADFGEWTEESWVGTLSADDEVVVELLENTLMQVCPAKTTQTDGSGLSQRCFSSTETSL